MLILRRRLNEALIIDGVLEVKIVEIAGGVIKLGISGPRDMRVDRAEVHLRRIRDTNPRPITPASLTIALPSPLAIVLSQTPAQDPAAEPAQQENRNGQAS